MASRFILHKFSGVPRSTSLLNAHASSAAAPAARYFNVFIPSSHTANAKTSSTTGTTSIVMKAKMAAQRAQDAAYNPLSVAEAIKRDVDTTKVLMVFTSLGVLYMSAVENTSRNSGSSHCLNCSNCPCHGSNNPQGSIGL